jgi:hypothetical protein
MHQRVIWHPVFARLLFSLSRHITPKHTKSLYFASIKTKNFGVTQCSQRSSVPRTCAAIEKFRWKKIDVFGLPFLVVLPQWHDREITPIYLFTTVRSKFRVPKPHEHFIRSTSWFYSRFGKTWAVILRSCSSRTSNSRTRWLCSMFIFQSNRKFSAVWRENISFSIQCARDS